MKDYLRRKEMVSHAEKVIERMRIMMDKNIRKMRNDGWDISKNTIHGSMDYILEKINRLCNKL